LLETQLDEDERMMRDSAHAHAQDKLQSRVLTAYAEETTDPEIFAKMGEMGLFGTTIPEAYGGLGAMMLVHLRHPEAAQGIMTAIEAVLTEPKLRTGDLRGTADTETCGKAIAAAI
jgi:alkylation response protein AidB-like acyl-CoA dehydrogenase